jgi:plasmid stabilization system protein ParE
VEIVWLPRAEKGLDSVIQYLETHWDKKQILQLEKDVELFIDQILKFPNSCIGTKYRKYVRKGYPNKHVYIIYRYKPLSRRIEILNFRATKQKPL